MMSWIASIYERCLSKTLTWSDLQPSAQGSSIFGKYLNMHLKFTVYGHKQARMVTHFCNAVPLVWGSLRLGPIKTETLDATQSHPLRRMHFSQYQTSPSVVGHAQHFSYPTELKAINRKVIIKLCVLCTHKENTVHLYRQPKDFTPISGRLMKTHHGIQMSKFSYG